MRLCAGGRGFAWHTPRHKRSRDILGQPDPVMPVPLKDVLAGLFPVLLPAQLAGVRKPPPDLAQTQPRCVIRHAKEEDGEPINVAEVIYEGEMRELCARCVIEGA